MNELYKIAASKKQKADQGFTKTDAQIGSAGAGVLVGVHAPRNLLGYESVHHGTPYSESIASIKKHGLRKSYAGSMAAGNDVKAGKASLKEVKGRVFTTKNKQYAKHYTHAISILQDPSKVLSMKVPYRHPGTLPRDVVVDRLAAEKGYSPNQINHIRVYKHSIRPRFIEGSDGYKGVKQFATAGNLRRYLSRPGGKLRMAKGIAQAATAGALMYNIKRLQDKKHA